MLNLRFASHSIKFLDKCKYDLRERVLNKIKLLAENPFPSECKRVKGRKEKTFRIRIGDYRVLYSVLENDLVIQDIDKRSRVYD